MVVTHKVEDYIDKKEKKKIKYDFVALSEPVTLVLTREGKQDYWTDETNKLEIGLYHFKLKYFLKFDGLGEKDFSIDKKIYPKYQFFVKTYAS